MLKRHSLASRWNSLLYQWHYSRAMQIAMLVTALVTAVPVFCMMARVYFNLLDWGRAGTAWYVSPTLGVAPLGDVINRVQLICDALMLFIALAVLRLLWVGGQVLLKRQ